MAPFSYVADLIKAVTLLMQSKSVMP